MLYNNAILDYCAIIIVSLLILFFIISKNLLLDLILFTVISLLLIINIFISFSKYFGIILLLIYVGVIPIIFFLILLKYNINWFVMNNTPNINLYIYFILILIFEVFIINIYFNIPYFSNYIIWKNIEYSNSLSINLLGFILFSEFYITIIILLVYLLTLLTIIIYWTLKN